MHAASVSLKDLQDNDLDIRILNYEHRDFDETSRKSLGASLTWSAVSSGAGWEDGNHF